MRSSNAGAIAILTVAVASALLGLAVIENPGVALPFSIEFIVLLGLTVAGSIPRARCRSKTVADVTGLRDPGAARTSRARDSLPAHSVFLRARCHRV